MTTDHLLLADTVTLHATAYVRNLVAAEQAVQRGQFNLAKILRAAATVQRTLALNAARLQPGAPAAATLAAIEQEMATQFPEVADPIRLEQVELVQRAGRVQAQLAALVSRALASLAQAPDVPETVVDQFVNVCLICGSIVEGERPSVCVMCGALSSEFDRFGPFYGATAERLGHLTPTQVVTQLRHDPEQIEGLVADVDDATLAYKPSADQWSIKEIVGHLAETDRLFVQRVRSLLDRTHYQQPLPPWKTHEGKGYETMAMRDILASLRAARQATLVLVESLTPAQWAATGPMLGEVRSVLDQGVWHANHDAAHIAQIRRMLEAATERAILAQ